MEKYICISFKHDLCCGQIYIILQEMKITVQFTRKNEYNGIILIKNASMIFISVFSTLLFFQTRTVDCVCDNITA